MIHLSNLSNTFTPNVYDLNRRQAVTTTHTATSRSNTVPIVAVLRRETLALNATCNVTSALPTAVRCPVGEWGHAPSPPDWQRPLTSLVNNNDARWALKDRIDNRIASKCTRTDNIQLHLCRTDCNNGSVWNWLSFSVVGFGTASGGQWYCHHCGPFYCQWWGTVLAILGYSVNHGLWLLSLLGSTVNSGLWYYHTVQWYCQRYCHCGL